MTRLRVAYDARHAARGLGISTFLTQLAAELVRLGDVELIWLGDPRFAPPNVTAVVRVDRAPYPLLDGPLGRARVRRLRADVMHFTGNTGWGRPGPVPFVLTLHDLIFMTSGARGRSLRQIVGHPYERRLIERTLSSAAVVCVPSTEVAVRVRERFDAALEPQVVVEGVSAPSSLSGPGSDRYVVAFAGRDPRKRTAEVVEGWRALDPGTARLVLLAGAGLPAGLFENLAPELGDGAVEIHGYLPREQLWRVLAGARALVYPSADEGFGLPVLEAMAAGVPVLAGLAPVTLEVGGDALVRLEPADVSGSIGRALRRLLASPGWAAELADAGRLRADAFTWRRAAESYRECYRAAIASRR